jgi:hypothetical protein
MKNDHSFKLVVVVIITGVVVALISPTHAAGPTHAAANHPAAPHAAPATEAAE